MMLMRTYSLVAILLMIIQLINTIHCIAQSTSVPGGIPYAVVQPFIITETTRWDTDDPAIWINPADRSKSLIIGTDKDPDGSLYVFDLDGKIIKVVEGLKRPNNIDIAYGFSFNGKAVDIAVVTESRGQCIRVFKLPEFAPLDKGDLLVFKGDAERAPMGVAIYKRPKDNAFFVFVSGKTGPEEGYIAQYRLEDGGESKVKITFVREFGKFSGRKEIEAIAVDNEAGYVYYSDETVGVRKYHADPDVPNPDKELALFATSGFVSDHEGISIYKMKNGKGYILVSDQQANRFWIFSREGSPGNPHDHRLLKVIKVSAEESDGSDVTSRTLSKDLASGIFVAMSNGRTFHYYRWKDIAGNDLRVFRECRMKCMMRKD